MEIEQSWIEECKPIGRPSSYSDEIADKICQQIIDGKSLTSICEAPEIPSFRTVYNWLESRPSFLQKYARAKEIQAERMAEEIITIADSATSEDYNAARLQVDSRKWLLSKLLPKKYGDATMLKHADADGNSLKVEVTRISDAPRALTPPKLLEAPKDDASKD